MKVFIYFQWVFLGFFFFKEQEISLINKNYKWKLTYSTYNTRQYPYYQKKKKENKRSSTTSICQKECVQSNKNSWLSFERLELLSITFKPLNSCENSILTSNRPTSSQWQWRLRRMLLLIRAQPRHLHCPLYQLQHNLITINITQADAHKERKTLTSGKESVLGIKSLFLNFYNTCWEFNSYQS